MRTAGVLACCLLLFPLAGPVPPAGPQHRAQTLLPTRPPTARWKTLRGQLDQGNELFRTGRYIQANQIFSSVFQAAAAEHILDLAARAAGNSGSCQFALHQYRLALPAFLKARKLAVEAGDTSEAAILDSNISSLYTEIGDLDTAAGWMQGTLERLSGDDRRKYLAQILIQLALIRVRQGRWDEGLASFRKATDEADRTGNVDLYTIAWNRLGVEYLNQGNLQAAESAFLEAFRVRKFNRLPLESSYRNLGRLRLEQGDLESASHLLDRCLELSTSPGGAIPAWDVYHTRGRVRLAQGRLRESLQDLRIAVRLSRAWRWSAPPNDAGRLGTEEMLDQVYAALIEAGNRLYLETRDPALIRETFEAAEENRAASLRADAAASPGATGLSPAYWETLLRLQRAEVQALRSDSEAARQEAMSARADLARVTAGEFSAQPPLPSEGLTDRVQAALDDRSALLSFHLGETASWMWALDRSGLTLYTLPPRRLVEDRVKATARALRENSPEAATAGAALYATLFSPLGPRFQQKTRWLLALDQGGHSSPARAGQAESSLFDAPMAALPLPGGAGFLVERRSTLVIPGAAYWLDVLRRGPSAEQVFVGIGDPIYNGADPRPRSTIFTASAAPTLALPRLVGSALELDSCARAWHGDAVLLEGADASRASLEQQIRRSPAVLHFATHFLPSATGQAAGWIALSRNARGEPELLSPEEIARWKVNSALVVLSGCQSAKGAVLPGTGLLGLTRAWLAAGARSVVGSRWSTPDDSGALFESFYGHLRSHLHAGPAEALRAAQIDMIHAGGWRSRPSFWSTWFTVGAQ